MNLLPPGEYNEYGVNSPVDSSPSDILEAITAGLSDMQAPVGEFAGFVGVVLLVPKSKCEYVVEAASRAGIRLFKRDEIRVE